MDASESALFARGCGASACESPVVTVAGEAFVDEAHDHGALADRGGATLDRPGANVAHCEYAGHACLEDAVGTGLRAGEDEAVVVERDGAAEPVGARCGPEEEEAEGEREPLAVAERRRVELAVGSV